MRLIAITALAFMVSAVAATSYTCSSNPECGDGTKDYGEGCDDGNTESGDGCSELCIPEYDLPSCFRHSDWTDHSDSRDSEQGWYFQKGAGQGSVLGVNRNRHVWTSGAPYGWPTYFRYDDTKAQLSGVIENLYNNDAYCVNVVMDILNQTEVELGGCANGAGQHCDPSAGFTYFAVNEDESTIKVCDGDAAYIGNACEIGYDDNNGQKPGRWGPSGNVLEDQRGIPGDFGLSTWLYIAGRKADINIDLDPCPQYPAGECPPEGFDLRTCYDDWYVEDFDGPNGGFVVPTNNGHPLHGDSIASAASSFSLCESEGIAEFTMASADSDCSITVSCADVGIDTDDHPDRVYGNSCTGELTCDGVTIPTKGKKKYNKEFYCEIRDNDDIWCGHWFKFQNAAGNWNQYGDIEWTPYCPSCGDGVTNGDESCDYSNLADPNLDACRNDTFGPEDQCTYCGDDILQFGLETCEPSTHPECDPVTCANRPQFPGCVTPFDDASICGFDFALEDYTAAGGLQVRNSYWPGEWTVLNFFDTATTDFDWCAPDNDAGEFEFGMSGQVQHPSGEICDFEYDCETGVEWAGVGYGLSDCGGFLHCSGLGEAIEFTPKANAEGYEATIHTKYGVTSISAWVCYPSLNHDGEWSETPDACGDIIATPSCPPFEEV